MFPQAQPQVFESINTQVNMHYLLTLPEGYEQEPEKRWPLLLTLHGGVGPEAKLTDIAIDLDIERVKEVEPAIELPFIIVSPRCTGPGWEPYLVHALLDEIEARYRVDTDREYVTGFSMGGGGTWKMAFARPLRFAALAPLASWGAPFETRRIKHIPVWLFHGAHDDAIPVSETETMAEALRQQGGDVTLTIYPDLKHPILEQTYSNPDLYRWLLAQTRKLPDWYRE